MQFGSTILSVLALTLSLIGSANAKQDSRNNHDFRGTLFPQLTAEGQELLRFAPDLLREARPPSHNFNPGKARNTTGVSMSFATDSPVVRIKFRAEKKMQFGIYQNGRLAEVLNVEKKTAN